MVVVPYFIGRSVSGRANALLGEPTFMPAAARPPGLDLLAEAAGEAPRTLEAMQQLHTPGPFNPLAVLPGKVVKNFNLELWKWPRSPYTRSPTSSRDALPTEARPPPPHYEHLPVAGVSHKATELFVYQASIIRAERYFEPGRWVTYDRQFRREALARKIWIGPRR